MAKKKPTPRTRSTASTKAAKTSKRVSKSAKSSKTTKKTIKKTKSTPAKPTKKSVTKKTTRSKKASTTKKTTAKTASASRKKTTTKKSTKKSAAKKTNTKKTSATKKAVTKKAPTKKPAAKKTVAKKSPVKKTPTKKTTKRTTRTTTKKPVAPNALHEAPPLPVALTDDQLRKVKTGLKKKDLDFFRAELLERRAEIIGDLKGMESARSESSGDISHVPLHMADVGSDNYDREFTLSLMESERKLLLEIDEALQRIESKTYGVCAETGQPIERPRLEYMPWAKYCLDVARERERRGL